MNELNLMIYQLGLLMVEIEELDLTDSISKTYKKARSINNNSIITKQLKQLCAKKENLLKEIVKYRKTL